MRPIASILFSLVILAAATSANAQYVYCTAKGAMQGDIQGEVTQPGLEGSIAVLSLTGGVTVARQAGSGQTTGRRQYEPFMLVKNLDRTSPLFFLATVRNERLEKVICTIYRNVPATRGQEPYFRITLEDAFVSSIQTGGNAQVNLGVRETIGFVFQTITIEDLIHGTVATDTWQAQQ